MAIWKSVLGMLAGLTVFAAAAEAAASQAVMQSCVTPLNNSQLGAFVLPNSNLGTFLGPASANPGPDTCESFTWLYSNKKTLSFSATPM